MFPNGQINVQYYSPHLPYLSVQLYFYSGLNVGSVKTFYVLNLYLFLRTD
jgi:hypothetical protein